MEAGPINNEGIMKNTERISRLMAKLCDQQFEKEGDPWGCDNAWRGNCFEAAIVLLTEAKKKGIYLKLVHGGVCGIGHAWCEDTHHVYDMTHFNWGGTYRQADYYGTFKVSQPHPYTFLETCEQVVTHDHCGPWAAELLELAGVDWEGGE